MDAVVTLARLLKRDSRVILGLGLWLGAMPMAFAANQLIDVKYHGLAGQELAMELVFSEPIIQAPQLAIGKDPAALVLSFADANSGLSSPTLNIDKFGVEALETQQLAEDLQVKLLMKSILPYQGETLGNRYKLTINDNKSQTASPGTAQYINGVKNLDFRRNPKGGGQLVVYFENDAIAADIEQVGAKIELKFFNTKIPTDSLYVMDVQDFATPVTSFETFSDDLTTRVLVDVKGNYAFNHSQKGNMFVVDINKVDRVTSIEKKKEYKGKNLSLDFQSIPVRTVLQIIADYNNFNLVTSDTVDGDITLRLDDVPWDQALDLILKTKGLDKRIEGNILMVAPAEELAIRESQNLKNKQEVEELAPLYSEYLQINYAKAADIAQLLKGSDSSLLTNRGSVAVDERTNTLLVKDTSESLANIARMVEILDIPIRQVLIESRMVTVKDNVTEDLGIRWGISDKQGDKGTSGSLEGAQDIVNGIVPSIDNRLNLNLPAATSNPASIAFHIAKLADGTILDLELSALEQENKGEIIASPRLMTSNQKAAYIEQGVEIPYVQSTSSGATSVTFKKAVLSLRVTPQITPDNRVILDLEITQDSQGKTVDTPTGPAVAIDTQRIGTQVLVDNGETIVLGGIYQQNLINRVSKVPLLGDIPYLGLMFRNSTDQNERQELLIFVTPKIVTEKI
ncbi:type IV pilus secretin PilQ [Shewanella sp. NIFS-20-20]|uniref:type IV pilus secretin PilQ n=1 Tax=Shewanella sp. NIFS-20-20 TaxID=2853806 RepID=UPI001C4848FD|nr:type IV pilus secretin PilQ family protein [Shewanella sp. NIFS-20-20]MBV7315629.1 type IV pilus secretin PilQ family protein [Shewanella sp. NIFS-20-20]